MRQKFLGSKLGSAFLELRRWRSLRSLPLVNPEKACAVANGILADRLISQISIPGGTFVDIGAHIGSVLSSVHSYDSTISIVAIEADPNKARYLRTKFPYCKVLEFAVGERSGTVDFYVNNSESGRSSLAIQEGGAHRKISVRLRTLDTLLPETPIDVIKIDTEGAELGVLKGGLKTVQKSRPIIMFESVGENSNLLGYSAEQIWEWFDALDFMVFTPDRLAHDVSSLTLEAFMDSHQYPFRTHNYFAVPREKRNAVRDKSRAILSISTS